MSFFSLIVDSVLVIVSATAFHAAWLNLGKTIARKYKFWLGFLEFVFLLIMMCFHGWFGSVQVLGAAIILFPAIRWMRDYLLNLLRDKSWNYLPKRDPNYGSFTDDFLRDGFTIGKFTIKIKGRHNQLAFRVLVLVAFFHLSKIVYYA